MNANEQVPLTPGLVEKNSGVTLRINTHALTRHGLSLQMDGLKFENETRYFIMWGPSAMFPVEKIVRVEVTESEHNTLVVVAVGESGKIYLVENTPDVIKWNPVDSLFDLAAFRM